MEIQNVIGKIRKLATRTIENGCGEGEALQAAAKIGELLEVYNLTIDQVFLENTSCVKETIQLDSKQLTPAAMCIVTIADFCDCKVWSNKTFDGTDLNIFGMPTDVEMTIYLFNLIEKAIKLEMDKYKSSNDYVNCPEYISRKSLSTSFRNGMISRVCARLKELKESRKINQETNRVNIINPTTNLSESTSLVHIKQDKVESEYEKLGLKLRYNYTRRATSNMSAYNRGKIAGNNVNFNRPIGNKSTLMLT